ncbi:MAG: ABC transporter permease [Terriglobales bacterium]
MNGTCLIAETLRALRRARGFSAAVVAIMFLAMAADFCAFGLLYSSLLQPLPVPRPRELVALRWNAVRTPPGVVVYGQPGFDHHSLFSLPEFRALSAAPGGLAGVFAFAPTDLMAEQTEVSSDRGTFFAANAVVSGGYFANLGLAPAAGRLIAVHDDRPGAAAVAVISYRAWRKYFGGSPGAVGLSAEINGEPYSIIGVAPKGFGGVRLGFHVDVWQPIATWPGLHSMKRMFASPTSPSVWWLAVFVRTRPGGRARAQAEAASIFRSTAGPASGLGAGAIPRIALVGARRGESLYQDAAAAPLWPIAAAAVLALLIACGSLGALLWARGERRERELAVRMVLGARHEVLVAQSFLEVLLLCGTAGVAAYAVAVPLAGWLGPFLSAALADFGFRIAGSAGGIPYVAFAVATLLIAAALGALPAALARSRDLGPALGGVAGAGGAARGNRGRVGAFALLAAQVAVSFVVVVAGVLFALKLWREVRPDPGFNPDNLLTFTTNAGRQGFHGASLRALYDHLLRRFDSIPGVLSASASSSPLIPINILAVSARVAGDTGARLPPMLVYVVGPNFLETSGIRALSGRDLSWEDERSGARRLLLNEAAAKSLPADSRMPLGRRLEVGEPWLPAETFTVTGVIGGLNNGGLGQYPTIFILYGNSPRALAFAGQMTFEVRTRGRPLSLIAPVRAIVKAVAPGLVVRDVASERRRFDALHAAARFAAYFAGALSLLVLLLACVSVWGVQAYFVAARRREFGVRVALGAGRRRILASVLWEGAAAAAVGLLAGAGLVELGGHLLSHSAGSLPKLTPGSLALAAALLFVCALAGGAVPANHAASVEPVSALRAD